MPMLAFAFRRRQGVEPADFNPIPDRFPRSGSPKAEGAGEGLGVRPLWTCMSEG